ncbi:MAG TPA: TonB-dependent receptor, partial [Vicinamibacterales bacterium]|nr:TonB-dependent receptor [Vicinamibacterales bacterium]
MTAITIFALIVALHACVFCEPQEAPTVVRGIVVDAATGGPLSQVLVRAGEAREVLTEADGTFELRGLPPGRHRLTVSVVGYILVQRLVDVSPAFVAEVRIPLSAGTGTYRETVTVTADPFRRSEAGVTTEQTLGSGELQVLRGVLADDPLRAVQALPGVATGDDLRSEFSVRGSDFAHMSFTVDGFQAPYLLHTVRLIEDRASSGSVAMINSDVVEEATLRSGGYPQRFGNRTGAELDLRLRAGSRDRRQLRAAVGGTAASVVAEGPLGRARRGSWLFSARRSYLDALIERLTDEGIGFAFTDVQGKLVYDWSRAQRLELTIVAGRSRLDREAEDVDPNDFFSGSNESAGAVAAWQMSASRGFIAARLFAAVNEFDNDTIDGRPTDRGRDRQLAGRTDFAIAPGPRAQIEGGVQLEHEDRTRRHDRELAGELRTVNAFRADAMRTGAYLQVKLDAGRGFSVTPGGRADAFSLTGQRTISPWMLIEWRGARGRAVRAGAGVYRQFPAFEHVVGAQGAEGLPPERAAAYDVTFEQTVGRMWRIGVSIFDREERGFIRRPGGETRVAGGRLVRGSPTAPFASRLDGAARGVELLAQRRDPNGLSGWLAYSYGRARHADTVTGEQFWADLDQRHALNAYAAYRLSNRWNFGAKLRIGSNFPVAGYYREQDGLYFASDVRNELRLPVYARLDVRAARTFTWTRSRLTLFGE